MEDKKVTDLVLNRLFTQMVMKGVIPTLPTGSKEKGEVLGFTNLALNMHRNRGSLPYGRIVELCMQHDLDMNFVFKGVISE